MLNAHSDFTQKYFSENSQSWVESSYQEGSYNFPTARARMLRTIAIIEEKLPEKRANIVDLGCGAGQLCIELASRGYRVTGIDESQAMISQAMEEQSRQKPGGRTQPRFIRRNLLDNLLEDSSADAVIALGVIGYLPTDDLLFAEAFRLLKPGGIFICSCRNRLFDMVSIGPYTSRDISEGVAQDLIEEIQCLFEEIPDQDAKNFVQALADSATDLSQRIDHILQKDTPEDPQPIFSSTIEARQHTPQGLNQTARAFQFEPFGLYGVHPHLLMASLNRLLPPTIFNRLSESLETLGHLPVSLIWSSAFIGVYQKS